MATKVIIKGITYYKEKVPIGRNEDGKVKYKQVTARTLKECKQKVLECTNAVNAGVDISLNKRQFGIVFSDWFENVKTAHLTSSSKQRYETVYKNYIKPSAFYNMRLTDIKTLHLHKLLNSLPVGVAHSTKQLLNTFFNYCVDTDLLIKNPLKGIKLPPKKPVRQSRALTQEERLKLVESGRIIYIFALYTGLRMGEVLALTHEDINLKANEINVDKSLRYMNEGNGCEFIVSDTKTVSSIRKVPLNSELKILLQNHIKAEKEKHLKLGIKYTEKRPLFTTYTGKYYKSDNILNGLRRLGFECTFHDLRHTFCTMLAENGVDLKTASVLMGHSDIQMTANIYTHVNNQRKENAIESIKFTPSLPQISEKCSEKLENEK